MRVSDGERVSTLLPSMSSKGDSSIIDFTFAHPSFLCVLAKVTSKERADYYDLFVEVFDFSHDLVNMKKEFNNEKVSSNPQAPDCENSLSPKKPETKSKLWKSISKAFKQKIKPMISIKLERQIQDSGID